MVTFAPECLTDRTILITGGFGGIGEVVVEHLLRHSARVLISDLVPDGEALERIRQKGWPQDRCRYCKTDVRESSNAQRLVEAAINYFGGLDVALCHAGIVCSKPILSVKDDEWAATLDVNLKGAFLVAQAAARTMIARGCRGKIIFTSSWVQDVPWPEITPYSVSKSGMKMLMRGMARELAPKGIRVNAVAPGIVSVGMAKRQWDTDPGYRRRAERAVPLGILQSPDSVADAFVFLCSDASDYMTGATLLVDGGCSLYPMD